MLQIPIRHEYTFSFQLLTSTLDGAVSHILIGMEHEILLTMPISFIDSVNDIS